MNNNNTSNSNSINWRQNNNPANISNETNSHPQRNNYVEIMRNQQVPISNPNQILRNTSNGSFVLNTSQNSETFYPQFSNILPIQKNAYSATPHSANQSLMQQGYIHTQSYPINSQQLFHQNTPHSNSSIINQMHTLQFPQNIHSLNNSVNSIQNENNNKKFNQISQIDNRSSIIALPRKSQSNPNNIFQNQDRTLQFTKSQPEIRSNNERTNFVNASHIQKSNSSIFREKNTKQSLAFDIFGGGDEDTPPSISISSIQSSLSSRSVFSVPRYDTSNKIQNSVKENKQRRKQIANSNRRNRRSSIDFIEEDVDDDFVPDFDDEEEDYRIDDLSGLEEEFESNKIKNNNFELIEDEDEFDFENYSDEEESESEIEDDRKLKNKKRKKKKIDDEYGDSDSDEFKTKKKSKKTQGDDAPIIVEATENVFHIELVLDHRDTIHENRTVPEYYIKWLGKSHIHNSWHVEWELEGLQGFKKLTNYIKKIKDFEKWKKSASVEELDQENVTLELERDLQYHWTQVDRVIGKRYIQKRRDQNFENNETQEIQYLVKWKYLPYSECTWEYFDDIQFAKKKIDNFLERDNKHGFVYHPSTQSQRSLQSFKKMESQPSWISGGELRDYQLEGVNWMHHSWCNNTNIIMADEMGLGKTIQTISFLNTLYNFHEVKGPFLIIVPLSTINGWITEFKKWAPNMNVIPYIGNGNSRRIARHFEFFIENGFPTRNEALKRSQVEFYEDNMKYVGIKKTFKFNVLLTTYELVIKDAEYLNRISWANVSIDEAHRLKNDKAKLYTKLFNFDRESTLLITGTPLQNTLRELWCLLHFLDQDKFFSFEQFEKEYSSLEDKDTVDKLHKALMPHILRRMKYDVEKSLPKKIERILRVGLSPLQKEYYKIILKRDYKELKTSGQSTNLSNIVVQLKKVCNHPYFFPNAREKMELEKKNKLEAMIEGSGKLWLLDQLLNQLKETGHRVLIFSQMVMVLDLLGEYLTLKGHQFKRLDGSTPSHQRIQSVNHFNDPESKDFVFLLTTRAGGLGINLTSADTVVIFDSDWNPQQDLQACSRAHRIGQKKVVNIYRLITKDTVEEKILEQAKQKMILDHLVIQKMDTSGRMILSGKNSQNPKFTKSDLNEILQFGAKELFSDKNESEKPPTLEEILDRAELQGDQNIENQGEGSLLGSFSVSNFIAPGITTSNEDLKALAKEQEKIRGKKRKRQSNWDNVIPNLSQDNYKGLPVASRRTRRKKNNENNLKDNENIHNFNSNDTIEFITIFKQFPDPDQIEKIIELSNIKHTLEDSQSFVQDLLSKCRNSSKFIIFNGIQVDAEEITRLVDQFSVLKVVSKSYISLMKNQQVNSEQVESWAVKWTINEDNTLLQSVLKYGIGNWEAIRNQTHSLRYKICPTNSSSNKYATHNQISQRLNTLLEDLRLRFYGITESELEDAQKPSIMKIKIKKKISTKPSLPKESCQSILSFIDVTIDELKKAIEVHGLEGVDKFEESLTIIRDTIDQVSESETNYEDVSNTLWNYIGECVGISSEVLEAISRFNIPTMHRTKKEKKI